MEALSSNPDDRNDIDACALAFVEAVVAGSHDTLRVFVDRFLANHDTLARSQSVHEIEGTLARLSFQTCETFGIPTRTLAAFRRLRPETQSMFANPETTSVSARPPVSEGVVGR
jgi:hypothetical protein